MGEAQQLPDLLSVSMHTWGTAGLRVESVILEHKQTSWPIVCEGGTITSGILSKHLNWTFDMGPSTNLGHKTSRACFIEHRFTLTLPSHPGKSNGDAWEGRKGQT